MIVLSAPFDGSSPIKTIEMPNPDLRAHEKVEVPTAFKTSMSGVIYGKRHALRPQVLVFTFSHLERLKARELEDFVFSAAGQFVRFIDEGSASWKVKLSLQNFVFTTTGRGGNLSIPETATATIELVGNKL